MITTGIAPTIRCIPGGSLLICRRACGKPRPPILTTTTGARSIWPHRYQSVRHQSFGADCRCVGDGGQPGGHGHLALGLHSSTAPSTAAGTLLGRHRLKQSRRHAQITLVYTDGTPTTITDSAGSVFTLTFDSKGHITRMEEWKISMMSRSGCASNATPTARPGKWHTIPKTEGLTQLPSSIDQGQNQASDQCYT